VLWAQGGAAAELDLVKAANRSKRAPTESDENWARRAALTLSRAEPRLEAADTLARLKNQQAEPLFVLLFWGEQEAFFLAAADAVRLLAELGVSDPAPSSFISTRGLGTASEVVDIESL
jgi:hypothetical protein